MQPWGSVASATWSGLIRASPAILTVVVVPQIAIDRNRSMTLIATMLVRTARPTATPTPAGPPEAL